eukprot:CAMPEP_0198288012 /NCGR_PEP_ID=MMETSP1449-20131203/6659_1 /TAXON_ID=420275 /ORGANISM="Attheya septentrionalis, Strain CCMP2084" /LENGTH=276 /DNA_ID=CAMNT_0043986093 /DNA_START=222 /DNA_END=1052 /DNA_ORIENTATION=+
MTTRHDDGKKRKRSQGDIYGDNQIEGIGDRADASHRESSRRVVVNPSSMMCLRAAAAAVQQESRDTSLSDHDRPSSLTTARRRNATKTEPLPGNAGVEDRHQKDVLAVRAERKKWSHVQSKLKSKAEQYERLRSQTDPTQEAPQDCMVDFSQHKTRSKSQHGHLSSSHENEGSKDKKMVQMEDEFGRTISVSVESERYRAHLTQQAQLLRQEEGDTTEYSHFSGQNDKPKDVVAATGVASRSHTHPSSTSNRSTHQSKKAARLELLRQKQAARQRK